MKKHTILTTIAVLALGAGVGVAAVSAQTTEPIPEVVPLEQGEVTLEKTVTQSEAVPGDTIDFSIIIENVGDVDVLQPVVIDSLPNGLYFTDYKGQAYEFDVGGTLAPGDSVTIDYQVTVKENAGPGLLTNVAVLNAGNIEEALEATASLDVLAVAHEEELKPVLSVDKSVASTIANPGGAIDYTVVVTNTGEAVATNVILDDILPNGFIFKDTKNATRSWTLGDIKVGDNETINYTVIVGDDVKAGVYENVAILTADNNAAIQDKVSLTVKESEVLGVTTEETVEETPAPVVEEPKVEKKGEVLAATGIGAGDVALIVLAAVLLIGTALGIRRIVTSRV